MLTRGNRKETEWNVVNGQQTASRSGGEFQFEIDRTVEFQLEATNRPGWFLAFDKAKRLVLSDNTSVKHLIKLEVDTFYDDRSDGK